MASALEGFGGKSREYNICHVVVCKHPPIFDVHCVKVSWSMLSLWVIACQAVCSHDRQARGTAKRPGERTLAKYILDFYF